MRSLKHQILILLLGSLVISATSIIMVLGWYMKEHDVTAASIKTQADLATCREIIDAKYPGPWSARDGKLYKGTIKISLNNEIVDRLAQLTGDTVTIFLGETRTVTTVRGSNGDRAIGTKASANVIQTVLKNGQTYIGEADVVGQRYQAVYAPLRAENGDILGMFYVGISNVYEQEFIHKSLITMAEIGLVITILVALLGWLILRRLISDPSNVILSGIQEAATKPDTQKVDVSGAMEIGKLEDAFIQMKEQIQTLTGEISRSSYNKPENAPSKSNINEVIEQLKGIQPMSELSQDIIDPFREERLSGLDNPWHSGAEELPKGLNKATLDQITLFLQANRRPISTEEVAEGVKLTRVTVRRYLEFLEQCGELKSEQKCGTVGRPVKIFIPL